MLTLDLIITLIIVGLCLVLITIFYFIHLKNCLRQGQASRVFKELVLIVIIFCLPFILLAGVFAYAYIIEPNWIALEQVEIKLPQLYEALGRLKIVHISDLAVREYGLKERQLTRMLVSLKPDIIFFTGELIGGLDNAQERLDAAAKIFKDVHPPLGIWAAPDSLDTDIMADKSARMQIKRMGIEFLINDNLKVHTWPGQYFRLAAVGDPTEKQDDLYKAMVGVTLKDPTLLLSHSPEIVDRISGYNVNLVLAGYTQGGQTGLAWLRKQFAVVIKYEKYISGLYKFGNTFLYVNRGIETAPGTPRFLCRPEVTLINITN